MVDIATLQAMLAANGGNGKPKAWFYLLNELPPSFFTASVPEGELTLEKFLTMIFPTLQNGIGLSMSGGALFKFLIKPLLEKSKKFEQERKQSGGYQAGGLLVDVEGPSKPLAKEHGTGQVTSGISYDY